MKAITVWQPWASLIAAGLKRWEFRSWPPPEALEGARIAVHAGARPMRRDEIEALIWRLLQGERWAVALEPAALGFLERLRANPAAAPLSAVVATATLGAPERGDAIARRLGAPAPNDSDRARHFNWGWPMLDVAPLAPPEPARGAQGLWNWTPPPGVAR